MKLQSCFNFHLPSGLGYWIGFQYFWPFSILENCLQFTGAFNLHILNVSLIFFCVGYLVYFSVFYTYTHVYNICWLHVASLMCVCVYCLVGQLFLCHIIPFFKLLGLFPMPYPFFLDRICLCLCIKMFFSCIFKVPGLTLEPLSLFFFKYMPWQLCANVGICAVILILCSLFCSSELHICLRADALLFHCCFSEL